MTKTMILRCIITDRADFVPIVEVLGTPPQQKADCPENFVECNGWNLEMNEKNERKD